MRRIDLTEMFVNGYGTPDNPFLDALSLGWQRAALNAFFIAAAFMVSGFALVWIDCLSARKSHSFEVTVNLCAIHLSDSGSCGTP